MSARGDRCVASQPTKSRTSSAFSGWVRVRVLGYGFEVRGRKVKSRDCALASDLVKAPLHGGRARRARRALVRARQVASQWFDCMGKSQFCKLAAQCTVANANKMLQPCGHGGR